MKNIKLFFILFLLITNLSIIYCSNETIGSDSAVSRQAYHQFSGFNNRVAGFASMENGFYFQDKYTTCTFDSSFPVDGTLDLREGTIYLNKNLKLNGAIDFVSSTTIYGNNNFIEFGLPLNFTDPILTLTMPTNNLGQFIILDTEPFASSLWSLDWNCNNEYITVNENTILYIYYFMDGTISRTASVNTAGTIYSTRWHPICHDIAIGRSGSGNRLEVYRWNISNGTISLVSSVDTGANVMAVNWHPNGKYLAILRLTDPELQIYSYNGTNLTYLTQIDIPGGTRGINIDTLLSWRGDGKYIASGFTASATDSEIYVHGFNGTTLTLSSSADPGESVATLDWSQTNSLIAVGLAGSLERLRIYKHNAIGNTLIEQQTSRTGEVNVVQTVSWKPDGKYLAFARNNGTGPEIQVHKYNKTTKKLSDQTGFDLSPYDGYNIRWSSVVEGSNEVFFAGFDSNNTLYIFQIRNNPIWLHDTNIIFHSDANPKVGMIFNGKSSINANNHVIYLNILGNIKVYGNSTLKLKNIIFKDVSADNITNLSNSGKIIFDNVTLIPKRNITFPLGTFEIYNDLNISGNYIFYYQSNKQSTIHSGASIQLKDNATFSYSPSSASNNLIIMEDETSTIYLNEGSFHSTSTGCQLTKGKLKVKGDCSIISDATIKSNGIKFGDGINSNNNLNIDIESSSNLSLISGHLAYKNIN
ncbi:MAG: WD40 repeat domain-containing protein [bacterium]